MGTVSIISPNLAALRARITAAAAALPATLAVANGNIAASIRPEIAMRYGPVAKYLSTDTTVAGNSATVRVHGDHQHLLWWEYGTRAHGISPINAQALRFTSGGATIFARHVNHPGTRAHNQRDGMLAALGYTCAVEWRSALSALLASL